jgi:mono/diheme cytochrome c family protein
MAEVVQHGTAHLPETDLAAMAVYLKTLAPVAAPPAVPLARPVSRTKAETGERLYSRHCADCHGEHGEGVAGAWPPLAGNRAVTLAAATPNLVQTVLYGGFAPATAGNPRPWGMPPFVLTLSDPEVAAVLTHLRTRWGNAGPEVTELEVNRVRSPAAH